MAAKIFIGNLSFETTQDELAGLAAEFGPTVDVFLPTDRATGRPRGFAFIEFEDEETAQKAIEGLNDREHRGRNLRVNMAEERPRGPRPIGSGGGGMGGGDFGRRPKPKGSRRNIRGRKRSL